MSDWTAEVGEEWYKEVETRLAILLRCIYELDAEFPEGEGIEAQTHARINKRIWFNYERELNSEEDEETETDEEDEED